ncbi:MAG: Heme/copper-type cytochrome/quinol oxidase, subunit 2 [Candidatus Nomurabacteria bacterium GW2011_GWA2_40_9]|uniref:Heme/copper-type cytochrome/quinol oxidase, subunit 2 n=1 Tax=Candidatus Nomurabacteria bacterium GW2011_GWA2_40_9 TaxID=1618734 RepID=A0A0G0W3Z5_9BACT|nr:MAG: Heme/copper-type cytochrome/quinol oxidase, subunit 2 [Candidatus Nomurabacteria bacterium GW2011_GWA2_40_9]
MKNTYIAVLVLILLGVVIFFATKDKDTDEVQLDENESSTEATNNNEVDLSTNTSIPVEDINLEVEAEVELNTVREFTVNAKNFSFSPSTMTVKKGDKVKITFINSQGFHDFKIDAYGVAAKQAQSPNTEVLEFIADKTGSFEYYCSVGTHRSMGMKGTLVVN